MPGLVACRRRWGIGSDDLMFPAFAEMWVRIAWVITIAVVFSLHKDQLNVSLGGCDKGNLLYIYYVGLLCVLSLHLLLDITMVIVATRGTVIDQAPRRSMPVLLYIKLILHALELCWTVLGTYSSFAAKIASDDQPEGCSAVVVWTVRATALVGWVIILSLLIGLAVFFDPLGKKKMMGEEDTAAASKLWEKRCRLLCCCAGMEEEQNHAFKAIAKLITDYFQGMDLVATDLAAGMVLIYIEQEKRPTQYHVTSGPDPTPPIDSDSVAVTLVAADQDPGSGRVVRENAGSIPEPKEWMTTSKMAHYAKFAVATSGWSFYMYTNMWTGCCNLMPHCVCCLCDRTEVQVLDDNPCKCNTAAIVKITCIKAEDVIYASFHNRVYEIPFYVAIDHVHKAVVVAIRGTLSLRDALVDLTADCEDVEMPDGAGGTVHGHCHKGIYMAASFIQSTLNNLQLLENAFEKVPSYQLVFTGHSLGAGTAAILSLMMRPKYPDLRCYAFSPPGGLISENLQKLTEEYVLSVVLGKDLVPRLSLKNMEKLKVQILKALKDHDQAKHKTFATGCWAMLIGTSKDDGHSDRTQLVTPSSSQQQQQQYGSTSDLGVCFEGSSAYNQHWESLEDAIHASERAQDNLIDLYPPGQILFINEEEPATSCRGKPTYSCGWAPVTLFDHILVNPSMLADHMPDTILDAALQLADRGVRPSKAVYETTAGEDDA